ncbi:MAG: glycerophosphodiester phosphodiesterase [Sphingobium sp.]|nr:glycerophosphodiester phosphodiesterase [Sphingobium sp.]
MKRHYAVAGGRDEHVPQVPRHRAAFLLNHVYAHRGLHGAGGQQGGPVENSMPAFRAALDAGYGIECDVHLSADGVAYVIHDAELRRLTGKVGKVSAMTSADLSRRELRQDSGPIPRLSELLALVAGRVPVLIEIKIEPGQQVGPLCSAVAWDLRNYAGGEGAAFAPAVIMSFHPDAVRWFRSHAPELVRGLVITEEGRKGYWHGALRALAMDWARPDFIAYDVRNLSGSFVCRQQRKGRPVLSWTVREPAQWQAVIEQGAAPIFERDAGGNLPAEALAYLEEKRAALHG